MDVMEVFCRHGRPSLGAEELLELGRPVPMHRYAHTPYLAGRIQASRVSMGSAGPFAGERNLMAQAAAPAAPMAPSSTLTKALIIGVPLAFVVGVFALT